MLGRSLRHYSHMRMLDYRAASELATYPLDGRVTRANPHHDDDDGGEKLTTSNMRVASATLELNQDMDEKQVKWKNWCPRLNPTAWKMNHAKRMEQVEIEIGWMMDWVNIVALAIAMNIAIVVGVVVEREVGVVNNVAVIVATVVDMLVAVIGLFATLSNSSSSDGCDLVA